MNDMKISGSGSVPAGEYGLVSVSGSAKFTGPVKAERVKISGSGRGCAALDAGEMGVSGSFRCDGALACASLRVSGSLKCAGPFHGGAVSCSGSMEAGGDVAVSRLDVSGVFTVKEGTKIEADEIHCSGSIKIDGQISADKVVARGFVEAREVVGDSVSIRSQLTHAYLAVLFPKLSSRVGLIEATTVELRGVTAETVNGRDVTIGPGCTIERLDCSGTLSIDPTASITTITGSYTTL